MKKIQAMTSADCEKVLEDGKCVIEGHEIEKNEIRFIYYLDSENDDNSQLVQRKLFFISHLKADYLQYFLFNLF